MTLLAEDPALWDRVFREPAARTRFIARLARPGARMLDVGCATGNLCVALARRGFAVTGVDLNARFIAAARRKLDAPFHAADMATFRIRGRFDLACCLGTTFSYNLTNDAIVATLANLRRHLRPGGTLVLDVLNAASMLGPRPFRARTHHAFAGATATIVHRLELATQTMTEQVTWRIGRTVRRDPPESLRLLFPQELHHFVASAGFERSVMFDGYGTRSRTFGGRRLVVTAGI